MKKTKTKKLTLEERVKRLEERPQPEYIFHFKDHIDRCLQKLQETQNQPFLSPVPERYVNPHMSNVCPTCGQTRPNIFYTTSGGEK